MTQEQISKLAKESAMLCMMHKLKCDKESLLALIERDPLRNQEFGSLYDKYEQLIKDVL